MTEPIAVLNVIDSLALGGGERMAVNVANLLPPERFESHLCMTRYGGPLEGEIAPHVRRVWLNRTGRQDDMQAVWKLAAYARRHHIRLIHAHKDSLFLTAAASLLPPFPALLWHDHYGRHLVRPRRAWLYRLPARRARAVIAVNQVLVDWGRAALGVPAERIFYVPNFVLPHDPAVSHPDLPGEPGSRIVCVANVRPQKDLLTLVRAMAQVAVQQPGAHLLVAGKVSDPVYVAQVEAEIAALGLTGHTSLLGSREDVPAILAACDVGVLSSSSEGLPLALLEYGMARLPAVVTDVGQCAEVLDGGRVGLLVPPGDPAALAEGLLTLLSSAERRAEFGRRLYERVQAHYSADAAMQQITQIYEGIIGA